MLADADSTRQKNPFFLPELNFSRQKSLGFSCVSLVWREHLKEYAQAEGVSAGFGVDLESASDLSREIRVSETAECWEKVQHTSARPHVDLVPGRNGTGTRLVRADT